MPKRLDEIRESVAHLKSGTNVVVAYSWGNGSEHLTSRVVARIEGAGLNAEHIVASRYLSNTPYGALRMWNPELFRANPDAPGVVDRLSLALSGPTPTILVVEHIQFLDHLSLAALEEAQRRIRVTFMVTASQLDRGNAIRFVQRPVAHLRLDNLSYLSVEEMIGARLGGRVDRSLIWRIYSETAGNQFLLESLLDSAVRHHQIVLSNERWTLSGDSLWSDSLIPPIEDLLAALSPDVVRQLERLALEQPVSLSELTATTDPATLDLLDKSGLLGTVGSDNDALIVLTQLTLISYFRRTAGALRHRSLGSRSADPLLQSRHVPSWAFRDSLERSRSRAKESFDAEPGTRTALRYLQALSLCEGADTEVERVFDLVGAVTGRSHDETKLILLYAQWVAHSHADLPAALQALARVTHDEARPAAEAMSLVLGAQLDRVPDDYRQQVTALLQQSAGSGYFRGVAELVAHVQLIAGDPSSALEVLDSADTVGEESWFPSLALLTRGLALFATGRSDACIALCAKAINDAIATLDVAPVHQASYVIACAHAYLGDLTRSSKTLSAARALGSPGPVNSLIQEASVQLAASVAAVAGKHDLAELVAGGLGAPERVGPYPGNSPMRELSSLIEEHEPGSVAEFLIQSAEAAAAKGYRLNATTLASIAVAINPSAEALERRDRVMTEELKVCSTRFTELARQLTRDDPDGAETLLADAGTVDREKSNLFLESVMLDRKSQLLMRSDSAAAKRYRAMGDTLQKQFGIPSLKAISQESRIAQTLSTREIEVSRLASTFSNAQIAERLGVSKRTVDHHISNALRKSGARNRKELASDLE